MFTGLVETIGRLRQRSGSPVARAFIETNLGPLTLGESIAVNGVCLTVDRIASGGFEADMSSETLERTTLGELRVGASVHLERAMALGGRMGGHIVLGHVDGVGQVVERVPAGDAQRLVVDTSVSLGPFLAEKGSIAVEGVSLTVNRVWDLETAGSKVCRFEVMLVPHTLSRTLLAELRPGSRCNLEVDVLARYVARTLAFSASQSKQSSSGWAKGGSDTDDSHNDDSRDERLLGKLRSGGFL